jgi:hypothetical protein
MKRFLWMLLPLLVVVTLISWTATNTRPASTTTVSKAKSENTVRLKPKVRLRWRGLLGTDNCDRTGRECGDCFGLCIILEFRSGYITEEEKELGDAYAEIELREHTLTMVPYEQIDNGDGTVTILEDYHIGAEFSNELGFKDVAIVAGTYKVDYSRGVGNGAVDFAVNTY